MIKMVGKIFAFMATAVFYSASVQSAQAVEIVHYDNIPVTVALTVGDERSIQFGDHVQVGVTKGQQINQLFRVQSAQGAVHILPYKTFDKQRVQIKRLTDGKVILLDLVATVAGKGAKPLENIRMVLASENVIDPADAERSSPSSDHAIITPVDLTRFTAQILYGPSRLQRTRPGITEATLSIHEAIKLFKGENTLNTTSTPVVAYQGGGYYLSGIYIKNTSTQKIQLNYLDLNLPFSHATFQHHALSPAGTAGDSTMLYLVSEQALNEILYPWTYYHDLNAQAEALARRAALLNTDKQRQYRKPK